MQPVKAVVENGRLMVDEPTELPDQGSKTSRGATHMDGFDFIAQTRSRREAANR